MHFLQCSILPIAYLMVLIVIKHYLQCNNWATLHHHTLWALSDQFLYMDLVVNS